MKVDLMKTNYGLTCLILAEDSIKREKDRETARLQTELDGTERVIDRSIKDYFDLKEEYKRDGEKLSKSQMKVLKEEVKGLLNMVRNYNMLSKQLELESGIYQRDHRQRIASKLIEARRR